MTGGATVGWCPGALRPMESGDGLVLRLKPSGGCLTLDQADGVARLALRHGNGQIDLTSRANLQVRGVEPPALDAVVADLQALDLVDRSADAEAVRNIVVSPLAGLDPAVPDIRPALRALERRLADEPVLHRLPAKWNFVLDDGGALPLSGVTADVRFVWQRDGAVELHLGGVGSAARVPPGGVAEIAARAGQLACERPVPLHMRDLAARLGPGVFAHLGLAPVPKLVDPRPSVSGADLFGPLGRAVGFAPAFGGLAALDLSAAVAVLRAAGVNEVRLTPWRTLLAPHRGDGPALAGALERLGFVLRPDDPRLAVSACVGAPACHRATTPTRRHAAALAEQAAEGVHVAGCAKGCGQTAAARWTLVGREGRYDVVRHGTARGAVAARGLSFPDAAAWISRAGNARTA